MSKFHFQRVRSMILASLPSDEADALRAKWAAESKLSEEKPVPTATNNILSRLVDEKVSEITAKQEALIAEQRAAAQRFTADMNRTLNIAFRKLIDANVATVADGYLYFELDDTEYRVYKSADEWLLESGVKVWKITGDSADMVVKLASTIAKIRAKV